MNYHTTTFDENPLKYTRECMNDPTVKYCHKEETANEKVKNFCFKHKNVFAILTGIIIYSLYVILHAIFFFFVILASLMKHY